MGLLGCLDQTEPATSSAPAGGGEGDRRFHARLLEIASSYQDYHSVNEEAHWAPVSCNSFNNAFQPVTSPPPPIEPLVSASGDSTTHGRKLYWLFAKVMPESGNRDYAIPGKPNPIGQVVVKEAWLPKEVKDEDTLNYAKKELTSGEKASRFARQA